MNKLDLTLIPDSRKKVLDALDRLKDDESIIIATTEFIIIKCGEGYRIYRFSPNKCIFRTPKEMDTAKTKMFYGYMIYSYKGVIRFINKYYLEKLGQQVRDAKKSI